MIQSKSWSFTVSLVLAIQCFTVYSIGYCQSNGGNGPRGFGADEDEQILPGFGGKVEFPYTPEDKAEAARLLRKYDRNRDGELDRSEARTGWSRGNPFELDYNGDDRLNLLELAQREARIRWMAQRNSRSFSLMDELVRRTEPTKDKPQFRPRSLGDVSDSTSRSLSSSVVARYDQNRDRSLSAWERRGLGIDMSRADTNADGELSSEELDRWLFSQIDERRRSKVDVLPAWFLERDENADGQIEIKEFSEEWTRETQDQFTEFDQNRDGMITSTELLKSKAWAGGVYRMEKATFIPPRADIVSEINVDEDLIIGDLNLDLTISHTYAGLLAGTLVAPDGQEVLLFSYVGGSGNHFDGTVFDDESRNLIRKGVTPFDSNYQPQSREKGEAGLSAFKGKNLRGRWQLKIAARRNDRFGILHSWALIAKPASK